MVSKRISVKASLNRDILKLSHTILIASSSPFRSQAAIAPGSLSNLSDFLNAVEWVEAIQTALH